MSVTAHTPGPWEVQYELTGDDGDELPVVTDGGHGPTVCSCWPVGVDFEKLGAIGPNQSANARLIAAAPELLDALLEVLTYVPGWNQGDLAGRPWLVNAKAKIAKATGGAK